MPLKLHVSLLSLKAGKRQADVDSLQVPMNVGEIKCAEQVLAECREICGSCPDVAHVHQESILANGGASTAYASGVLIQNMKIRRIMSKMLSLCSGKL